MPDQLYGISDLIRMTPFRLKIVLGFIILIAFNNKDPRQPF